MRHSSGGSWHGVCPRDCYGVNPYSGPAVMVTQSPEGHLLPPHAKDTRGQRFHVGTQGTIAESQHMPMFSFNKCCHTVFKVVVHFPLSSHSHQRMKVPVASHHCQPLVWADFLILALLEHMMKFTVVLILISLMTNKVEHFFTCLLVIQISSFYWIIFTFFML